MDIAESDSQDVKITYDGSTYDCRAIKSLTGRFVYAGGMTTEGRFDESGFVFEEGDLVENFDRHFHCVGITDEGTILEYEPSTGELVIRSKSGKALMSVEIPVGPKRVTADSDLGKVAVLEEYPSDRDRQPETYIRDCRTGERIVTHDHGSGALHESIGFVTHEGKQWLVIQRTHDADYAVAEDGETRPVTPDWDVYRSSYVYVQPSADDAIHVIGDEAAQGRSVHRVPDLVYETLCDTSVKPLEAKLVLTNRHDLEDLPADLCSACSAVYQKRGSLFRVTAQN